MASNAIAADQQLGILKDLELETDTSLASSAGHDAAVVLVSPSFARSLDDQDFMSHLVKILSKNTNVSEFHVVSAVVDHIAPLLGSYEPIRGLSILRGHLNDMLPQLWEPAPPSVLFDQDAVSALDFHLGANSVCLPLARTPFLNSRPSTLLTSRYDLSGSTPKVARIAEKRSQRIAWSSRNELKSVADLRIFAPLVPLTEPREVAESFGNIIRRIKVESESVPASTELESAVNDLHEGGVLSEFVSRPVSVWAAVTPCAQGSEASTQRWSSMAPSFIPGLRDTASIRDLASSTASYLSQLYAHGGRIYRILSGGGGWGAKKGLLSLDPQHTHFAMSEEEEMARFIRTMEDSTFTPRGSRIQFFISPIAPPQLNLTQARGLSLGVAGGTLSPNLTGKEQAALGGFIDGHFGALSGEALFISGPGLSAGETTKMSVHHSRIFVASDDDHRHALSIETE